MSDPRPSVLIVEDEAIIAMDIADAFEDAGWRVLGPCGSLRSAESQLEKGLPDAALLDMNLSGTTSLDFAARLVGEKVHVAFLTGDEPGTLPGVLASVSVFSKPMSVDTIISEFKDNAIA